MVDVQFVILVVVRFVILVVVRFVILVVAEVAILFCHRVLFSRVVIWVVMCAVIYVVFWGCYLALSSGL
jgi:hypothetical protein